MTSTGALQDPSLHQCPKCGVQCAVAAAELETALRAEREIRIACHNCSETFEPTLESTPDPKAAPGPASGPAPAPRITKKPTDDDEAALDVARCPECNDDFSVPTLPSNKSVEMQCPFCAVVISSDDLDYTIRDGKPVGKNATLMARVKNLFKSGKKDKKAKITPRSKQTKAAEKSGEPRINRIRLFGKSKQQDDTKPIIDKQPETPVDAPKKPKAEDSKDARKTVVTRLFQNEQKAANDQGGDTKDDTKSPEKQVDEPANKLGDELARELAGELTGELADKPTEKPAETKAKDKPAKKRVSPLLIGLLGVLIFVIMGAGSLILEPSRLGKTLEIFSVRQVQPANFSITNAVYERIETEIGKSVVITISLENTGAQSGTPETIMVELLNEQRQPILSWPVATNAMIIEPGQSRALITRIFEPPSGFNDIQVTLVKTASE